jgi:hypothetical protein
MKVMLTAFLAIGLISVGAYFGLKEAGFSSSERQNSDAVRLD